MCSDVYLHVSVWGCHPQELELKMVVSCELNSVPQNEQPVVLLTKDEPSPALCIFEARYLPQPPEIYRHTLPMLTPVIFSFCGAVHGCIYSCVYGYICKRWALGIFCCSSSFLFFFFSFLFFETRSFTGLGAHGFDETRWPANPRNPCVSAQH